jgi:MFS family permease
MAHPQTRDVERWFLRRGFSALLDGTSMRRRRAARLARALAVVFVLVMVLEVPSYTGNLWITLAVSVTVVLLTWLIGNLIRRRPPFALPDRVTALDRAVFLLFPPLVLLFVPQDHELARELEIPSQLIALVAAFALFLWQVVLLVAITLLAYSGVMALGPWLWRRVVASFLAGGTALGRTLPLLLGVVGFLFFTGELWQSVGRLSPFSYALALGLFIALGSLFLYSRGLDLEKLARFDESGEVDELVRGTPLHGGHIDVPAVCPLTTEQQQSLKLVMVISKLTLSAVVGLAVFVFFVLLGITTVNAQVVQAWTQAPPQVITDWSTGLHSYALTHEHLRVCGFLAVFAGFYFAVVSATDPAFREGLRDDAEDDVRQACAARLVALQRYPEQPVDRPGTPDAAAVGADETPAD